jgi:hypothetical protein
LLSTVREILPGESSYNSTKRRSQGSLGKKQQNTGYLNQSKKSPSQNSSAYST